MENRLFTRSLLRGSLILLSIFANPVANAANWPVKQMLTLQPQQQLTIDLQLQAKDYIAGSFHAEQALAELKSDKPHQKAATGSKSCAFVSRL